MLTYFFMGLTIGVLSCVPIGPVNLTVIDSAYRYGLRRAVSIGFGGSIGDGIYAFLGILVMGPVLAAYPVVTPVLYAVSGVVLFVYAIIALRSRPSLAAADLPEANPEPSEKDNDGPWWSGILVGIALVLMNPAALVTWVIIVGLFMQGATPANGASAIAGVVLGSLAWFTSVAYLANHGRKVIGAKTLKVTRLVAYLILGYSIFAMVRAIHYWLF